jgi:hypothetical protein
MKKRAIVNLVIALICFGAYIGAATGHSGPVDREGCHYGYDGKRHCH